MKKNFFRLINLIGDLAYSHPRPDRYHLWSGDNIIATLELDSRFRVQLGAQVTFSDHCDRETVIAVHSLVGSAYLNIEASPLPIDKARQVGLKLWVDEDSQLPSGLPNFVLRWAFWNDPNVWKNTDPAWRYSLFHPTEALIGRPTRTERELEKRVVNIPLPEGPCEAEVRLFESTWTYPRWPWPSVYRLAQITPRKAPVVPGKGENSWDCDDDALYEMQCPARTIEDAAGRFLASVIGTRQRRANTWGYPRPAPPETPPPPAEACKETP